MHVQQRERQGQNDGIGEQQCQLLVQWLERQGRIGGTDEQQCSQPVQMLERQGQSGEIVEQQCQLLAQWLARQGRIDEIGVQPYLQLVQMLYIVQLICDLYATADWIDELLRVMLNRDWHPGLLGHQPEVVLPTSIAPSGASIVNADRVKAGWPICIGVSRYDDSR